MNFDIAIIGGGPAGYNAAEKAAANGLQTVLFEKSTVGGVCLNEGCIPTKTLLYAAKLADQARHAGKYGVSIEGTVTADHAKIIARKNKVVRKLTAGVKAKLTHSGVTLVNGWATLAGEKDGSILIRCNEEAYAVAYVLLCTGSETIIPPIKGLERSGYWTSKEALDTTVLPESLAIIGGGVIGMEFASYFNSMGVQVEVIEMQPEILGAMDEEISALLRSDYTKKGVRFHLQTKVVEVTPKGIVVEKDGQTSTIPAKQILLSTGRKPNITGFGLEGLPVEADRKGIHVNEYMQTTHPRVYAAGDATGFSLLAHTAIREGEVAINHILGIDDPMSYRAIPGVVYTNPEIAGVGQTEKELEAAHIPYRVMKLPMTYSGRFMAENEEVNGLCKIIVDAGERIIGCHLIGNPASELIVTAGIAIEEGCTIDRFKRYVIPHPTVGEIFREVIFE